MRKITIRATVGQPLKPASRQVKPASIQAGCVNTFGGKQSCVKSVTPTCKVVPYLKNEGPAAN